MARWNPASWIGAALFACGAASSAASPAAAQQSAPPFVDLRRLPPSEAEIKAKAEADRREAAEAQAKQKAEEERRQAAEAQAKQKAEEERRQAAEAQAKQKAEEERRQAAEAQAKQKAEEERRQAAEAQAKQKAEEERRQAAEAQAKQKAEEERRQAAEAQAKQKAEEERRQAAEAQAKQKAEEERRQAAEAQAKQKAEEERRQAAEAQAKQRAEEERRQAAEAEAKKKAVRPAQTPPAPAAATRAGSAECGPDRIAARAIIGGRVELSIDTPCRPGQSVVLRYGAFEMKRQLDDAGRGVLVLDLFQGKSAAVSLQIGTSPAQPVSLDAVDLSGLSKAAVVWKAPVNLDLHVYEYAARHGGAGHIWSGAPSSAETSQAETRASKRGRGFLSTSDDGRSDGDKVEVYTFWHHPEQRSGIVATALDYETRGAAPGIDTCGTGVHASVVYETFLLTAQGELSRERGAIAPATCGTQLLGAGRYMEDAVPDLHAAP